MQITSKDLIKVLEAMGQTIASHKDYLTELDAAIGDADHGINMDRGFSAVVAKLVMLEGACCGTVLKTAGMTMLSTVGGASGPLFGTAFMNAGNAVMGKYEMGAEDAAKAVDAAVQGVMKRGSAILGDKTMVDTLLPVSKYMGTEEYLKAESIDAMQKVLVLAEDGMNSTMGLIAKRGRSSFLGERSAGHLDPGAVSSYLLIGAAVRLLGGDCF